MNLNVTTSWSVTYWFYSLAVSSYADMRNLTFHPPLPGRQEPGVYVCIPQLCWCLQAELCSGGGWRRSSPVPLIISARRILHRERASVASCHAQIPHETLRLFQKTKQIVFIARLTRVASRYNLFYVSNRLVFIHIICYYRCLWSVTLCNVFQGEIKTQTCFFRVHSS